MKHFIVKFDNKVLFVISLILDDIYMKKSHLCVTLP